MAQPRIELVVTDLDGTLWTHGGVVAPSTERALTELARRGVPVLVATGRRVRSARQSLVAAGLGHLPVVGLNGSVGVDGDELFHAAAFAPADAVAVHATYRAHGVEPVAFVAPRGEHDCVVIEGVSTHPDHLAVLAPSARFAEAGAVLHDHEVVAFSVLGLPRERLAPIYEAVLSLGAAVMSPDRAYGEHNLAVTPRGISKWIGVLSFCARTGVDPGGVLAIGDDDNDTEMLAGAAVGLAMAHSPLGVRAAADAVVGGWDALLDWV